MLYDKICSYDNLLLAYRKARKNKTSKWYVWKFEKELEKNLIKLESELRAMKYKPHALTTFIVRDPKTRTISSSHFRDRVVYHAICNVIEPIFESSFIHDSYASRKNKGTHAALRRFDVFKRKASKNGRLLSSATDNNYVAGYVLKADIKHYFDSVDHQILMNIISRKIKDEKVLLLIKNIIDNFSCKTSGKGMPIGNLTSQFFANVYLNELDYFVKHRLKAKYYIRYLDDFVVLHANRKVLEKWKVDIDGFLTDGLKLELHPDKSKIYPLKNGIRFLGFRVFYNYKVPKRGSVRRIRKKTGYLADLYSEGTIERAAIFECAEGWDAYAMHSNTYKLRKILVKDMKKSINRIDKINIKTP